MRRLLIITTALAAGLAFAAVITASGPASKRAGEKEREQLERQEEFRVHVTSEMKQHTRIRNLLYFAGNAWLWAALLAVMEMGWSSRLRQLAGHLTRKPFLRDSIWFAMFLVVMAALLLPLDFYSGFVVPHKFDLSNQSLGAWLIEDLKTLGVALLIGSPIAAAALMLIRKKPRRWWLWLWGGTIPLTLISVLLAPLVIEPLFNDFRRLENRGLEQRLLSLAGSVGIEGSDVFQVDKSKQTRTMNAYVTGLGVSKRIVIWDTLLQKMNDDEVVFVMAHEMGHYVRHDIWKGMAFGISLMFAVFWGGSRVAEAGVKRFGEEWGVEELSDPAAIPWYLLILAVATFLLSPVFAGYSRSVEHRADLFALDYTGLNEPGARAFIKLAEGSKIDPTPHRFMKFWRYSHPPLSERIELALGSSKFKVQSSK